VRGGVGGGRREWRWLEERERWGGGDEGGEARGRGFEGVRSKGGNGGGGGGGGGERGERRGRKIGGGVKEAEGGRKAR